MATTAPKPRKRATWNYEPTFSQWLYTKLDEREGRETQEGEFARWAYADNLEHPDGTKETCWPHRSNTLAHMKWHLKNVHKRDRKAPDELTLHEVFARYHAFVRTGEGIPHRQGGIVPSEDVTHRGYRIAKETIEQIRELAIAHDMTQGEVIERAVGKFARSASGKR